MAQQIYPPQPEKQAAPLMDGGPPPVEGAAALKFAENATPEQMLTVMDYVNEINVKQKAFLLEAVTGGGCIPATYSVKDTNGTNLLYAVEYSHPCTRCCCGMNRKMRLDVIPAAAVEDPSGDAKFSFSEMKDQLKGCFKYGGADGKPVVFTIERSMEGSCFPCCRYQGACLGCCLEKIQVKLGAAQKNDEGKPLPENEDTRPVIASVTQPFLGGGCTPTFHMHQNGPETDIVATEKGAGGLCESCCPGFCMCACTDNVFELYPGDASKKKDVEPNGHITRVNPKDLAGWCRQAFTDADSYDIKFPPVPKEQKAAYLAAMLLTDLSFFDDGGDVGCDMSNGQCKTIIKLAIINCYGCSFPLNCVIDWKGGQDDGSQ
mmetsp:Transcript_26241/g.68946  ORF Transcript_26241/g.68946 Transcript_26241/m.68946 type:complete len:375 (+) Transcript_26241:46-1170(+)